MANQPSSKSDPKNPNGCLGCAYDASVNALHKNLEALRQQQAASQKTAAIDASSTNDEVRNALGKTNQQE